MASPANRPFANVQPHSIYKFAEVRRNQLLGRFILFAVIGSVTGTIATLISFYAFLHGRHLGLLGWGIAGLCASVSAISFLTGLVTFIRFALGPPK
jgi:hypothetical protein